jgi:hypothetical protein
MNVRKLIPKTCAKVNRIRGTKNEKGEAPYLFRVSLSSAKRTQGDPFHDQLRASTTAV